MKTLILTVAIALTSMTSLSAQEAQQQRQRMTPEQMVEMRLQRMTERYSLTTEQQTKLKTILEKQPRMFMGGQRRQGGQDGQTGATARQNNGTPRFTAEQMDSVRKVMEANEAEIKAVLTPEQLKKYEEDRAQAGQRFGTGGQRQRPQGNN